MENKFTFKGGIHPDDKKERTRHLEVEELPAAEKMIYPVQQHIGAPAKPIVQVGERVLRGQLIAESGGFVSANIHCSVSGTVTAIQPMLHPQGSKIMSIIVENDGLDELFTQPLKRSLQDVEAREIPNVVKAAGIVGMGGAAFPTHVKLSPPKDKSVDTVIVNGAECEPYLTSDHRSMLEDSDMVIDGTHAIKKTLGAKQCYIAIEDNKGDAIEALSSLLMNKRIDDIKIAVLKSKYPQGAEKQIICAITGREVPPGQLPLDCGVVVDNVETCVAIARAIKTGQPLMSRVVTVGGGAIANHRNFRVRIGTPVDSLIQAVGGYCEKPSKVILGGPMMGISVFSTQVPIIKGTGALIALSPSETYVSEPSKCMRCGECVKICPMRLQPLLLNAYSLKGDLEECERLNIKDCVECGACAYICPGKRSPVQNIRNAKYKLLARKG